MLFWSTFDTEGNNGAKTVSVTGQGTKGESRSVKNLNRESRDGWVEGHPKKKKKKDEELKREVRKRYY